MTRRDSEPDDLTPLSFEAEESADLRRQFLRQAVRLGLIFALLMAAVSFAFWWSGSAVRFGAARVADRSVPTWQVTGMVRDAVTHAAIPWARIEDDPNGQAPYFQINADQVGQFVLPTLAEPHRIRISAPGYRPAAMEVGRVWFLWMPRGKERRDVELTPEP